MADLTDRPFTDRPFTDRRILDLFGIALPVIQAPMANATTPAMAAAASEAGGLGSLPAAQYTAEGFRAAVAELRAATARPFNLNFFAHRAPADAPERQAAWRTRLRPLFAEAGLDPDAPLPTAARAPFDAAFLAVLEEARPAVASFHFGLPAPDLLARVKAAGCKVVASATTVAEALWLEAHGADAVIAQGAEAGGHRGTFLAEDPATAMATQPGTLALVPQVADAVRVPVIAAGGIADPRGVRAALALGAAAVQVGTAYLLTPEARIPAVHRTALERAGADSTAITNLFTGRPARGIVNRLMRETGPLSPLAPPFPTAGGALAPLRAAAEAAGRDDFTPLWAGQAAALARPMTTADLTRYLATGAH